MIEVGVTDDQLITVKISFESDGTTPATADMSPYKYLMSGNGNGTPTKVNKLVSWQCSGNIATASVAIRPGSSNPWSPKDELYLVTYTDDGELTREHASDTWYNDLQNGWTKIELGDSFELPHYMVTKTKEEGNELQYTAVKKEANDDRMTDYSLETLLEHYNIITLCPNTDSGHEYNGVTWGDGDFVYNQHTVGGILVRGDLIIKVANSIGGGNQATQPSAVGGAVIFDCGTIVQLIGGGIGYNDRHNPFYVGEVNCIVDGKFYYSGGLWNINTYGPTIANNDYVDWDALQASIIRHSRAMENSSTRTVTITNEGKQTINVQAGEKIKVVYGPGVDPEKTYITVKLDLMGQQFDTLPGTVISFAGGGNQYIPKLETINGETLPDSCDNGDGISVIYNFPEASALTNWDGNPEYGHVIAPFADVVLPGSNYNGCVIANSCYSGSEGHLSPYKGGTIIGFYGKLKTDKTVDNKEPTDRQVFKFVMQHLRNVVSESEYLEERGNGKTQNEIMWDYIGATMNNHSLVEFDKVPFYEAGTYYFLVYESTDKQYPDITLDPVKYIVEADVVANTIGENVILSIDSSSLKYYKVTDEANLITVNQDTTTGEYRATINEAAITLLGDLTWDNSTSTLNTPIEFQNKEKKSGITIRKVVTGTDDPTAEFPFKLYVWYEDEDTVNGKTSYIAYDGSVNANDEIKSFESSTYKLNSEDEGHTAGCVQFNLTTARPITFVGLPVGAHYAFVEDVSNLPTGYTFYSKTNDTGVVPETGTPSATVEFTNSYIYTYLDVEKKWSVDGVMTDDPGDGINEISFYLYRKTDSVEEIIDSETKEGKTDKYDAQHPEGAHPFTITKTQKPDSSSYEWKLHIDGLKKTDDNGNDYTYWITEDQVDGYSVAITMVKDDETVNVGPGTGCEQAPAESTITITNSKYSISLPETGGSGTTLYTLLGGLMVVAAGAVLTLRKKKNKA